VASLRFGSVLYVAYPQDHTPRHLHGFLEEAEVILDLGDDRTVRLATRLDAIRPPNAKTQFGAPHFEHSLVGEDA
jgi:hypothetical protein